MTTRDAEMVNMEADSARAAAEDSDDKVMIEETSRGVNLNDDEHCSSSTGSSSGTINDPDVVAILTFTGFTRLERCKKHKLDRMPSVAELPGIEEGQMAIDDTFGALPPPQEFVSHADRAVVTSSANAVRRRSHTKE
eukprot:gnl/TRDRNA2_/TRDRNA2_127869_c0_seq1.p1 gnl/TRDRNA2_/TRDRNA2_127869_c0~~gnl/TRDRNA2_/TRDRNA2_127869_c0_seq1.p1  ORF type:complete len:137 (-),score=33.85 gnl/TRDRNA2_/TRDRNA2_127869_c0_seq1:47-457(-)